MKSTYFAMAIHFHQPIGNFENIFSRAYQLCYWPFVQLLWQYPQIKMTFHISGCLLDYLERKHPEMLDMVKQMVSRGQLEIMGGGYYEPILAAIPQADILGQINLMSRYIRVNFGTAPSGMWIAERVWEPQFAGLIYDSKIRYSILDDLHFLNSGVAQEQMQGYFLTGKPKQQIAIFPCDKSLRYMIPFKMPQEIIDYFKNQSKDGCNRLFTYGDDGEKFGEWPGTHKWVFEERWLKNFFDLLVENREWLKLVTLGEYLNNNQPIASINIQSGSYEEMMEWSGGSWKNFLERYPESNQMHKRMCYISAKIRDLEKLTSRINDNSIEQARRQLYQGQCNCAYWHGVFGGLYLYHLRSAIYQHLISADKIADTVLHKKNDWRRIKAVDFNLDKKPGVVMEDNSFFLYLDPHQGAVLKELDSKTPAFNLVNTLSRQKEAYHQKILNAMQEVDQGKIQTIHGDFRVVDPVLKKKLIYDKFPRFCLRSYFINQEIGLSDFIDSTFEELGDFANGSYAAKVKPHAAFFQRQSKVGQTGLKLTKQIQIKSAKEIEVLFQLQARRLNRLRAAFGVEFNLTMPALNSERYSYFCGQKKLSGLNSQGSVDTVDDFGIADSAQELAVKLEFSPRPLTVWYFPVQTVSQSERAYELNYQCSCIFPRWYPDFSQNKRWELKVNWVIIQPKEKICQRT